MKEEKLYLKLNEYRKSDCYPFHMPGHKRNMANNEGDNLDVISPYCYDITEIEGFDNLHMPEGIIRQRMDKISSFYESEKSYFLVNGSTCGILAAISAVCHNGRKIVMARNSHKSAYNSAFINKLEVVYIYPDLIEQYGINGGIPAEEVEEALGEYSDVGAVYITSPTYEGIVSDVLAISSICHKYKVPLIVDEAHGAHFSMHDKFPVSALELGADVVIQSLHKTLPALTQTAILHIGKNALVETTEIERYLAIYQTSSPSYVLMASIDQCLDRLMKETFLPFEALSKRIEDFRNKAYKFTNIYLLDKSIVGKNSVYDFDISKLVIFAESSVYTGHAMNEKLSGKYHIQMEMESLKYVIGMTSIMDTKEGFRRLAAALEDMDREIRIYEKPAIKDTRLKINPYVRPVVCKKIYDGAYSEKENVSLDCVEGRIAGEFIFLYPPGVPLIVPGEMFTTDVAEYIKECISNRLNVIGIQEDFKASVIKESWTGWDLKNFKTVRRR